MFSAANVATVYLPFSLLKEFDSDVVPVSLGQGVVHHEDQG